MYFEKLSYSEFKATPGNKLDAAAKPEGNILNVDDINKRLQEGDKTALKELENNNIEYTYVNTKNGFYVSYQYNNKTYNIRYENPETDSDKSAKDKALDLLGYKLSDLTTMGNSNKKYESRANDFDYSVVPNLNGNVSDYSTPSLYKPSKGNQMFDDLSKIKPQFASYLKAKLQEKGIQLSDTEIDKCLNMFITIAARAATTSGLYDYAQINIGPIPTVFGSRMNTVEDVLNSIVYLIDNSDYNGIKTMLDNDSYLLNTCTACLSDEEKITQAVVMDENNSSITITSNSKEEVEQFINCKGEHLTRVLKQKYPDFTEEQAQKLQNYIKSVSQDLLNRVDEYKNNDGSYNISMILSDMYSAIKIRARIIAKIG